MAALIEESEASPEVLVVYADIKATRKTDWVNNFWKALANHPTTLKRMWGVMALIGRRRLPTWLRCEDASWA
jgi:hypothetical protein